MLATLTLGFWQLQAARNYENNCWMAYLTGLEQCNGSMDKVIPKTDLIWENYVACSSKGMFGGMM